MEFDKFACKTIYHTHCSPTNRSQVWWDWDAQYAWKCPNRFCRRLRLPPAYHFLKCALGGNRTSIVSLGRICSIHWTTRAKKYIIPHFVSRETGKHLSTIHSGGKIPSVKKMLENKQLYSKILLSKTGRKSQMKIVLCRKINTSKKVFSAPYLHKIKQVL